MGKGSGVLPPGGAVELPDVCTHWRCVSHQRLTQNASYITHEKNTSLKTLESEKKLAKKERLLQGVHTRKLLQKIFHPVMCVAKHCAKILR